MSDVAKLHMLAPPFSREREEAQKKNVLRCRTVAFLFSHEVCAPRGEGRDPRRPRFVFAQSAVGVNPTSNHSSANACKMQPS